MTEDKTAERKADTGPLPSLPTAPASPARRRPGRLPLVAGGAAVIVIAGVLLFALRPNPMADQRPVETVRGFIAALEARDANLMLSYFEPTVLKRQLGPEVRSYVSYIEEMRFDDARYELTANDGERAQVKLTANMRYRVNLGSEVKSGERAIDAVYDLRNVEGAWYISGAKLPPTK